MFFGAVNTHDFVWQFYALYINVHSVITCPLLVVQGRGGSEKNQTAGEERLRRAAKKVQIVLFFSLSSYMYSVYGQWSVSLGQRS